MSTSATRLRRYAGLNDRRIPTPPLHVAGWPLLALAGFYMVSSFLLAAMRIRDLGLDPAIVVSACIAVLIIDRMIASKMPGLSLPKHNDTIIGSLMNFGLALTLLFWPGREPAGAPRLLPIGQMRGLGMRISSGRRGAAL